MCTPTEQADQRRLAELVKTGQWFVREWAAELGHRAHAARGRGDVAFAIACEAQAESALSVAAAFHDLLDRQDLALPRPPVDELRTALLAVLSLVDEPRATAAGDVATAA